MKTFSIVGAGRLGTSLGAALARQGWRPQAIVDRDPAAARAARRIVGAGRASTALTAAAKASGPVLIAVPDDVVAGVVSGLARAGGRWDGRCVFHTSGLLPAAVLEPLARRGARVASLHPVQSFPQKGMPLETFEGITWGIEGDAPAIAVAEDIARDLGGNILRLTAGDKALYHAACALASNALVALEWTAAGLLGRIGLAGDAAAATLVPLAQGTLQNVKSLGLEKALTGPVLRGDVATVEKHLEALAADPDAREIYRVLGKQVLRLAAKKGLPAARVRALKRLLGDG